MFLNKIKIQSDCKRFTNFQKFAFFKLLHAQIKVLFENNSNRWNGYTAHFANTIKIFYALSLDHMSHIKAQVSPVSHVL